MKLKKKKPLELLVGDKKCPHDFACYTKPHKIFHKPQKFDSMSIIECIRQNPGKCKHAVSFGDLYFCKCPLGGHIANNMYE